MGISCAVVGAILVARGVGFVFWLIVAVAAVGLIAAFLFRFPLEGLLDLSFESLADRYREERAVRPEAEWLPRDPGAADEHSQRLRAMLGDDEA